MKEKLVMLRNTLAIIETKGEGTLHMADCMKFISQLITECENDSKNEKEKSE